MNTYPQNEFSKRLDILTSLVKPLADLNLAAGANALDDRITAVIDEVSSENNLLKDINEELGLKICLLEKRLQTLENEAHKRTVLIRGIPHIDGKSPRQILTMIFQKLGISIKINKDIETFKQIPLDKTEKCGIKTYVIEFYKKAKRDLFLDASQKHPLSKMELQDLFDEDSKKPPICPSPRAPSIKVIPPKKMVLQQRNKCPKSPPKPKKQTWVYMILDNDVVIGLCYPATGTGGKLWPIVKHMIMDGPPLDLSFRNLNTAASGINEDARTSQAKYKVNPQTGKIITRTLRISNNNLTSLRGLKELADHFVSSPQDLAWIDVSFNKITTIDRELLNFPELQILYFHGNNIQNITDLARLEVLPKLRSITLHGNPIETEPSYRSKVISYLPNIKIVDFSDVTDRDRAIAAHYTCQAKQFKAKCLKSRH